VGQGGSGGIGVEPARASPERDVDQDGHLDQRADDTDEGLTAGDGRRRPHGEHTEDYHRLYLKLAGGSQDPQNDAYWNASSKIDARIDAATPPPGPHAHRGPDRLRVGIHDQPQHVANTPASGTAAT